MKPESSDSGFMLARHEGESMHLELRGVTKRFGSLVANRNINLNVEPGTIHCLLGENGAGKSTLMNVLFGLLHPDEGEILIDGKPVVILYAMGYTANAEPYFKYLRQRLAKRGLDPYLIADIVYWDPLEKNDWGLLKKHFQAITTYNLWTRPNFLNAVRAQFRVADRMARESGLRLIPNVMPGYDDTRLRGLTREIFDRRGGQFYRDYWSLASDFVDARQPFLFITSFNEWHEGSELEPSAEYGDTYLELTRKQTAELRKTLGLPKP